MYTENAQKQFNVYTYFVVPRSYIAIVYYQYKYVRLQTVDV